MTLDTCAAIIGSEVMSFKTEEELLTVYPLVYPYPPPVDPCLSHCTTCILVWSVVCVLEVGCRSIY